MQRYRQIDDAVITPTLYAMLWEVFLPRAFPVIATGRSGILHGAARSGTVRTRGFMSRYCEGPRAGGSLLFVAAGLQLLLLATLASGSISNDRSSVFPTLAVARSPRSRRATELQEDAGGEIHDAGEEDRDPEDPAEEHPPETGLRRWVIKIRNFMFGRRDLEASEDGEEPGQPPDGQTWMESLAQWFAHGIKNILLRLGGGSEGSDQHPVEGEGEEGLDEHKQDDRQSRRGADRPRPSIPGLPTSTTQRPPPPQTRPTGVPPNAVTSSRAPIPAPPASLPPTSTTTTSTPFVPSPLPITSTTTTSTKPPPAASPINPGTIFDDETLAVEAAKKSPPVRPAKPPVEETNELK